MKDISDIQVLQAYIKAKTIRDGGRCLEFFIKKECMVYAYDILMKETGECEKVCYRCMERAEDRGLIDYGVSLRTGWITEKGKELLGDKMKVA